MNSNMQIISRKGETRNQGQTDKTWESHAQNQPQTLLLSNDKRQMSVETTMAFAVFIVIAVTAVSV